MSRRLFLERIVALIGISVATPMARAASRKVELQRSPVAGFHYHQAYNDVPVSADLIARR